jgi:hypothetical protein
LLNAMLEGFGPRVQVALVVGAALVLVEAGVTEERPDLIA